MLDFQQVQMRGLSRAALVAQGAEAPPHTYLIDPLVQQLSGEDYCVGNGTLLTPHEAQHLAMLLHQMGCAMDALESHKAQALAEAEEAQEVAGTMYGEAMRYKRILRWVMIVGGISALLLFNVVAIRFV